MRGQKREGGSAFAFLVPALAFLGGIAALSWELLWQHHTSLALGVSAQGAAITLAVTMGGMAVGALVLGNVLQRRTVVRPLLVYGVLEALIGLCGFLLQPGFARAASIDASFYQTHPGMAGLIHLSCVVALLGLPAFAMGATIPVLGLVAQKYRLSLARLYAFNTAGAAIGVCLLAFVILPHVGVRTAIFCVAGVNGAVAVSAILLSRRQHPVEASTIQTARATLQPALPVSFPFACTVVFITGFATFALEVAWFRAILATFFSTTDAFALILFAVLISLALGARLGQRLKESQKQIPSVLALAGCLILLATPFVERFDTIAPAPVQYWVRIGEWLALSLAVMGPPMLVLGAILPWILDSSKSARQWGLFYGINTFGAVLGSLVAAWGFLPLVGFSGAAWIAGSLVCLVAVIALGKSRRSWTVAASILCLVLAIGFSSGAGRVKAYGRSATMHDSKLIEINQGAHATTAVIEWDFARVLLIDGFGAALQLENDDYMDWMGRLPMLLHPHPKSALVIAFGSGQTSHAVRDENPGSLDIVDINPDVFKLAHHFDSNHNVLDDPRVNHYVMDGRAWLRRTTRMYDIVTLEPMPPNFAGTNALYSREFYEIMSRRLNPGAVVAQWLPIHIVTPQHSIAIAAAFRSVFSESIAWKDPKSGTLILLGRFGHAKEPFGKTWPGFARNPTTKRKLNEAEVIKATLLLPEQFNRYVENAVPVTDDNQVLAYGSERIDRSVYSAGINCTRMNLALISRIVDRHE